MKSLLTIFTLVFTMMFSSTSFAEWTEVSKNERGDTQYVDFERVRKVDGHVYFWLLNDFLKPITDMKLLSSKTYRQVDCKSFGFKNLSYVYHKESMGRDNGESAESVNKDWRYPQPNTVDEFLVKLVCSR